MRKPPRGFRSGCEAGVGWGLMGSCVEQTVRMCSIQSNVFRFGDEKTCNVSIMTQKKTHKVSEDTS